ncbi:hypothetical protein G6F56_012904 [Rhizopus delemar]|nr:hypothetical protein G6F56_012904 [Rhizopus delemar]
MRRTTTELQQELNSLKNEVRALKNHNVIVDQSVAPNLTPMQRTASTANTLISRIPQRPACTFLQGDADKPHLLDYIRETMNLVEERGDSEIVEMRKAESINSALCDLEGMAKTVCGAMANAVSQDPSLDKSKITGGKVPTHYRDRGLKTLIATAKQFNFHLDRSVGDWASLLLLSSSYHNNYNPKKPTSSNRSEQNMAGSSGNVEESIEQERHLCQTSHDSEHSTASESRAMASKRRRQET